MNTEAFEIGTLQKISSRKWLVGGRAHVDLRLSDRLAASVNGPLDLEVSGIVTYRKSTDLLSKMMTGTLTLEGEINGNPRFLYIETK